MTVSLEVDREAKLHVFRIMVIELVVQKMRLYAFGFGSYFSSPVTIRCVKAINRPRRREAFMRLF